jgi:hypothetical protein
MSDTDDGKDDNDESLWFHEEEAFDISQGSQEAPIVTD